jgi:MFS family permease
VFLFFLPGQYRLLFALTAIPGALAVATLFFVDEPQVPVASAAPRAGRASPAAALPTSLYRVLGIIFLFSLGNSADAFLLLRLSDALGSATYVPLLWAALHVVKASLSTWGGALSDRIGRARVIAMGWAVYAVVYLGFAVASSATTFIVLFLVYGVHFALAEGAEKALVADLTPSHQRGTAFGLYNGVLGAGLLIASVLFGLIYERISPAAAFGTGATLAAAASLLLLALRTDRTSNREALTL